MPARVTNCHSTLWTGRKDTLQLFMLLRLSRGFHRHFPNALTTNLAGYRFLKVRIGLKASATVLYTCLDRRIVQQSVFWHLITNLSSNFDAQQHIFAILSAFLHTMCTLFNGICTKRSLKHEIGRHATKMIKHKRSKDSYEPGGLHS